MKTKIISYYLRYTPQGCEVYIKLQGAAGFTKTGPYNEARFSAIAATLATNNAYYEQNGSFWGSSEGVRVEELV